MKFLAFYFKQRSEIQTKEISTYVYKPFIMSLEGPTLPVDKSLHELYFKLFELKISIFKIFLYYIDTRDMFNQLLQVIIRQVVFNLLFQ